MTALLRWVEHEYMKGQMEWRCHCDDQVSLVWTCYHDLYDTVHPIGPEDSVSRWWSLECQNGHVLLRSHELADGSDDDAAEAPTVQQIAERLATPEDVAAWLAYLAKVAATT